MVRLGAGGHKFLVVDNSFQFQYGAIGRRGDRWPIGGFTISIPVWCDWESIFANVALRWFGISIPVWCDWERDIQEIILTRINNFNSSMVRLGEDISVLFKLNANVISIPVWCDWEYFTIIFCIIAHLFQFQYGAIGRIDQITQKYAEQLFQFQYGAIGSPATAATGAKTFKFQFQYGAIGRIRKLFLLLFSRHFNSSMVRLGE